MNLFISKIHEILDKIRTFAIRCIVKPERSGEHIDNRKPKEDTEMKEYKLEQFLQDGLEKKECLLMIMIY